MKELNSIADVKIEDMGFTVRTYNSLRRAGVMSLGDIAARSFRDLLRVRNLGSSGAREVMEKAHGYGVRLKDEELQQP